MFYLHLFCCFFMTGLIWLVQNVHYPSFHFIDEQKFEEFSQFHSMGITFIVLPIMTLELILGGYLFYLFQRPLFLVNFIGCVLIWASTFFLSVPLHGRLGKEGRSREIIDKLILTNLPRTLLWTLRSFLLMYYLMGYHQL